MKPAVALEIAAENSPMEYLELFTHLSMTLSEANSNEELHDLQGIGQYEVRARAITERSDAFSKQELAAPVILYRGRAIRRFRGVRGGVFDPFRDENYLAVTLWLVANSDHDGGNP